MMSFLLQWTNQYMKIIGWAVVFFYAETWKYGDLLNTNLCHCASRIYHNYPRIYLLFKVPHLFEPNLDHESTPYLYLCKECFNVFGAHLIMTHTGAALCSPLSAICVHACLQIRKAHLKRTGRVKCRPARKCWWLLGTRIMRVGLPSTTSALRKAARGAVRCWPRSQSLSRAHRRRRRAAQMRTNRALWGGGRSVVAPGGRRGLDRPWKAAPGGGRRRRGNAACPRTQGSIRVRRRETWAASFTNAHQLDGSYWFFE